MSTSPTVYTVECVTCLETVINPILPIHKDSTNTRCNEVFCKFCQENWQQTCQTNTKEQETTCVLCRGTISGYIKLYDDQAEETDARYSKCKPKPFVFELETATSPTDDDSLPNTRSKCVRALIITAAFALSILAIIGPILFVALV